jgi:hypothetical protein
MYVPVGEFWCILVHKSVLLIHGDDVHFATSKVTVTSNIQLFV